MFSLGPVQLPLHLGRALQEDVIVKITTQNDWWDAVYKNWPDLLDIVYHHMDPGHVAYDIPGDASSALTGRTIATELERLKDERDDRTARYLAAAWCMASDAYAWSVPSWGVLCDLLSEEWVIHESEGVAS